MKILKIFGIVVGIHVFALILIFANPGCSSTTKPAPAPAETAATTESASPITSAPLSKPTAPSSAPITFNPDAPAGAAPSSGGPRTTPTRPGTPVAGALVSEPVTDVTPASTYTVKSGDNLWSIAKKNNVTVAQLTAVNSLSANASLKPGQKLRIPGKPASPAAAATATGNAGSAPANVDAPASAVATKASSEVVKHTVRPGETLGAIARKYDVRQGDIAVANNISDPAKIRPGMELIIPGWQATGTKTSKKAGATMPKAQSQTQPAPQPSAPAPTAEPTPATPPASSTPQVPVIRIDEGPVTPAPKP